MGYGTTALLLVGLISTLACQAESIRFTDLHILAPCGEVAAGQLEEAANILKTRLGALSINSVVEASESRISVKISPLPEDLSTSALAEARTLAALVAAPPIEVCLEVESREPIDESRISIGLSKPTVDLMGLNVGLFAEIARRPLELVEKKQVDMVCPPLPEGVEWSDEISITGRDDLIEAQKDTEAERHQELIDLYRKARDE